MYGNLIIQTLSFCLLWKRLLCCITPEYAAAQQPGDIIIGGIFPIHEWVSKPLDQPYSKEFICTGLQLRSMVAAFSFIHVIEKINNSTLLPGITLGYEIYDSCSDSLKATQAIMRLIPEAISVNNSVGCHNTEIKPSVKVVVGEMFSEISVAVSRILNTHFIPQISPASSAAVLSNVVKFPSFLRTVPNDIYQTIAIAKLIKSFGWNWVGVIATDDDYGRSAIQYLTEYLGQEQICSAFSKVVPSNVNHSSLPVELDKITQELTKSSANVVVVVVKSSIVIKLFERCIRMNISKVWIATDVWSSSKEVSSIEGIEKVGTILGVDFTVGNVEGFAEFLQTLHPSRQGVSNRFLEEYKELRFGCPDSYRKYLECINSSSKNCILPDYVQRKSPLACIVDNVMSSNDDYLLQNTAWSTVYSTSLAVTAIAQSLKNIICKNGKCDKDKEFSPRQWLRELKNGNYSFNGEMFSFDVMGDVLNGYDIIYWQQMKNSIEFRFVGKYDISNGTITLNRSLIFWNTRHNEVPFSNCSETCTAGYYKQHSYTTCCYKCIECTEGYYSPAADMDECLKCPLSQWSKGGSSQCENRTTQFLHWKNPFAITLAAFASFGFLLVLIIGFLFLKHSDTPVVKAAGGSYTYPLILSLLVSLTSIVFFIGHPSDIMCQIRQPLYGVSFTLCVCCILIKSLLIILAFESAKRAKRLSKLTYQPVVIIGVLTGVQMCICIFWLLLNGPFVAEIYTIPYLLILQCDEGSYVPFGIMLGYIGFLALTCFLLAYKGRKFPEKYNEARSITFSMLIYMFVWIIFIPVYMHTSGMYLSAVQIVAILASVYGVIACHLLAPCYIILFKRKSNNRERYLHSIRAFCRVRRTALPTLPSGLKPLTDLSAHSPPSLMDRFRYAQLCSFFRSQPRKHAMLRDCTRFEDLCLASTLPPCHISRLYGLLLEAFHTLPPSYMGGLGVRAPDYLLS
ncbi:G-protein coupled receptor family C group 6 member A-like [Spea bombifrons]|uniref:G-protein coupled receptor family C group 6 member A-like n=1 Tax=Spea bombifrons TaxID=233779 RepID=UPI00234BB86A|nr:G-protein coupled receptor family C group 6 member A-like [Spea bombifrons]